MKDMVDQLRLPGDETSPETRWVVDLKRRCIDRPEPRGDRLTANYKIRRDLHGQLQAECARLGLTATDLIVDYIKRVLPTLGSAAMVDVPGYSPDKRTKAAYALKLIKRDRQQHL